MIAVDIVAGMSGSSSHHSVVADVQAQRGVTAAVNRAGPPYGFFFCSGGLLHGGGRGA